MSTEKQLFLFSIREVQLMNGRFPSVTQLLNSWLSKYPGCSTYTPAGALPFIKGVLFTAKPAHVYSKREIT